MDFLRKSFLSIGGNFFGKLINFFYSIILVNYLSIYDYGIYVIIFLIPLLFSSIFSFGIGPSIVFHFNKMKRKQFYFFWIIVLFYLILGILLFFIFTNFFFDYLYNYISKNSYIDAKLLLIAFLVLPIALVHKCNKAFMKSYYLIEKLVLVEYLIIPIFSLISIIIIYYYDLGLTYVIFLPIANIIIANILYFIFLNKFIFNYNYFILNNKLINFRDLQSIIFFGLKTHLGTIVYKNNMDVVFIILTSFLGPVNIAKISLSLKIVLLFRSFVDASIVHLSSKITQSNIKKVINITSRIIGIVTFYILICVPIIWFIIPEFIPLVYGSDFKDMHWIIRIMSLGILISSINNILLVALNFIGYPIVKTTVRIVSLLITILILFFTKDIVPLYSGPLSISIGLIGSFILTLFFSNQIFKINILSLFKTDKKDIEILFYSIKNFFKNIK